MKKDYVIWNYAMFHWSFLKKSDIIFNNDIKNEQFVCVHWKRIFEMLEKKEEKSRERERQIVGEGEWEDKEREWRHKNIIDWKKNSVNNRERERHKNKESVKRERE